MRVKTRVVTRRRAVKCFYSGSLKIRHPSVCSSCPQFQAEWKHIIRAYIRYVFSWICRKNKLESTIIWTFNIFMTTLNKYGKCLCICSHLSKSPSLNSPHEANFTTRCRRQNARPNVGMLKSFRASFLNFCKTFFWLWTKFKFFHVWALRATPTWPPHGNTCGALLKGLVK